MNTTITVSVEALGLTGLLITLGGFLKQIPKFPDNWIPTALVVIGTLIFTGVNGFTFQSFVMGFQASAAATGINQMYRQHTNGGTEKTAVVTPSEVKTETKSTGSNP